MLDADWVGTLRAGAPGRRRDRRCVTWACLYEGAIPRWFDNDGGIDDDEAFTAWWPRWVERAADSIR
jgi:hypothetical protein